MSVDVEDYFHVSAFEDHIRREDWDRLPCRVEGNVERVLALFEEHGVKTTFFTLGWVAERYPQLVRNIVWTRGTSLRVMGCRTFAFITKTRRSSGKTWVVRRSFWRTSAAFR